MRTALQQVAKTSHCAYCGGFMDIPPLIQGENGKTYINPDADMLKIFYLEATPFGGTEGTVGPGQSRDFTLTVPAEENHLGDMLVNRILAELRGTPGDPVRRLEVEILSLQNDRLYQNGPISNTLIFGDSTLDCCLPCCFLIQATNSVIIRVVNREAVDVECRFVAVGQRFLPYHAPELRAKMLSYWNSVPSTPYYLRMDTGTLNIAAGDRATTTMSVPGGGDFQFQQARCLVIDDGGGSPRPEDILLSVSEGVGRTWQRVPLGMGAFLATPSRYVTPPVFPAPGQGLPNSGMFAAAQLCHCVTNWQFYKRNTRIRLEFENLGTGPALIDLVFVGCMHYVGECPPGRDMDRARSLEPSVGPMLIPEDRYCPPEREASQFYIPPGMQLQTMAHGAPMRVWRPAGTQGNHTLPWGMRFAQDDQGKIWVENYDPNTGRSQGDAPPAQIPPWVAQTYPVTNLQGLSGLGAQHEWARL